MAYVRMKFKDPAAVLADYTWEVMHTEEESNERRRNVERTAPTSGVGFVRQQGQASPRVLRYTGVILTAAQKTAFDAYYDACETRTIRLLDFDNTEYEVLITSFDPKRERTLRNPRDSSIPLHFWRYTIELEVIGTV